MRRVYLDYNATTPLAPSVRAAMLPFLDEHFGNPSSTHLLGRACQEALEDARLRVAQLIGADRAQVIFTSGGTESNNAALFGVLRTRPPGQAHLVVSALEHPSVLEPARALERLGYAVTRVSPTPQGVVQAEEIRRALRPETVLVSVMAANNEIGTLQPLAEIARCCRPRGVLLHSDAAQAIGKIPLRVDDVPVDLLTLAGHKCYAPKGIGALYVRNGVSLEPLLFGAGHEGGLRPGTENVPSIVALGAAALLIAQQGEAAAERMRYLRDDLEAQLRRAIGAELSINGSDAPRLPNTSSVNFPGVRGADLLRRVPEICASTGAACHAANTTLSTTQAAIGLAPEVGRGTVRLSLGWETTQEDVDQAAHALLAAWDSLR